jgi:Zn-dependent peptidase ImmA (M78 family)/transcriptional regulator with XRE-family HTH domain
MIGMPGFVGERLTLAREARGLTAVALAEMIGVNSANISNYEHGKQSPTAEVLERISDKLSQPVVYFLRPIVHPKGTFWWRSMSSATKLARSRAHARHAWLREIVAYLGEYVDFPTLRLPDFNIPQDFQQLSSSDIENFAMRCREEWRLGSGPIADNVLVLENNGVIVSRGELGAETLDAYSHSDSKHDAPIIFLGSDKSSAVRSRHDSSHELGHLVLHSKLSSDTLRNPMHFKIIEDQAHRFASAFNMPANGFADQLWIPSLEAFLALKPYWKVSIAAMIERCEQLGILNEMQKKRMYINMSRKGWRRQEPLDDRMQPERPRLLRRSFELLVDEGIKSPEQIVIDLSLNPQDIESLACLNEGYLSHNSSPSFGGPKLRDDLFSRTGTSNVLTFAKRS